MSERKWQRGTKMVTLMAVTVKENVDTNVFVVLVSYLLTLNRLFVGDVIHV